MRAGFYRFLIALYGVFGPGVFGFFTWWVVAGYYFLFPRRLAVSVRFYRAVFPERKITHQLRCAWKQYRNFSRIFLDRLVLSGSPAGRQGFTLTHEGAEHLYRAVADRTGGILLMSHVGNWETAALLLKERGQGDREMKLLLYVGRKHKEQIERLQKENLSQKGIRVIASDRDSASPADIVEGVRFLKAGGLVSLTGDRLWRADQRSVPVTFFGRAALIPETPFILAFLSGAPLLIFFTYRTSEKTLHFKILPPIHVTAKDRSRRDEAVREAAQLYATALEETVRQRPFEWFHFEPFIK